MNKIVILVATIPARKRSCERLLAELAQQSRRPDGVILVMDGYGAEPPPACPLDVLPGSCSTNPARGAGGRWLAIESALEQRLVDPDDVVINLDDDAMLMHAPKLVEKLVATMEKHGAAAAAMGRRPDGRTAPPGSVPFGELVYGAGLGLAVRAKHLAGLGAFAEEVKSKGGPDALGVLGDDDALVSAWLWKTGVKIHHSNTGNLYAAPGTNKSSQTRAKLANGEAWDRQKIAIKQVTGWPWPMVGKAVGLKVPQPMRR